MPGTPFEIPKPVCDCCRREVDRVRSSLFHGDHALCIECFFQWYDPDPGGFDPCDPLQLGNHVRAKHGLPPLQEKDDLKSRAGLISITKKNKDFYSCTCDCGVSMIVAADDLATGRMKSCYDCADEKQRAYMRSKPEYFCKDCNSPRTAVRCH